MIHIRRATQDELEDVQRLAYEQYLRCGYIQPNPEKRYTTDHDNIVSTRILVALKEDKIVGTLSYTLDGPLGLPVDVDYRRWVNIARKQHGFVACCWRFVTDSVANVEWRIGVQLAKATAVSLVNDGEPHCVSVCHPQHVGFYARVFGATAIATRSETTGLKNAPSVLMAASAEQYGARL